MRENRKMCNMCVDCNNIICSGRQCKHPIDVCKLCGCEEFDGIIPLFDENISKILFINEDNDCYR